MYFEPESFYHSVHLPFRHVQSGKSFCFPSGNHSALAKNGCNSSSTAMRAFWLVVREAAFSVCEGGASDRFRLGTAIYHAQSGRLTEADGNDVLLRHQSAQILQLLVARAGELVSRDVLIDEVWPDVSVTDDSLTQCIADIRRAIGDGDHSILRTVRKRGYVLRAEAITGPASPASVIAPESVLHLRGSEGVAARLDPRDVLPTLAILPMRALSKGDWEPIGIFAADEISSALSRSQDANVISRLSTVSIGESDWDVREVGRRLNADFVLSGLWVSEAGCVILSVELADTENGFVLWSDRMKLRLDQLMRNADWVDSIVHHIRSAIMLNETRRLHSCPIGDLKLFSVLHGAIGLMHRFSIKEFNTAKTYLEYVAEQVSDSPVPLAWLARWHVLRSVQGWTDTPDHDAREALDLTARALDLDPTNVLALVCEGQVLAHLARRLDESEERYALALSYNPNDAQGLSLSGMLAAFRDNPETGIRNTERALHLTPLDPHRFFYLVLTAAANLSAGEYDRAVALARESLRLNRTHVSTLRTLAAAQVGAGDPDGARKTVAELMRQQPDLRVSAWQASSPSAEFRNGRRFADLLRRAGVPD
ncbi:winged helix-turn-helix domain-containing tetratricopeptide repeat protein [Jannaschia marina]|uniref:winged helix-turn-helix domain-containing tetratricopeptide repeat protein n=1 Tax=Jannaschia marina TaxID=2741674 RepID=UPI0015C7E4DC|nr:winged helix-turn-helix domain-containing protein [Jannaschia marina]